MEDYKKKYKYAMEAMREWISPCHTQEQLDNLKRTIFPELAESEDERIRKELIEHVKDQQSSFISAPDCRDKYEEEENNKYNSWIAWLEKQGKHSIYNVPSREVILAIWDLGNEWKELTNGSISTEYGTQLDYIQKHWHESEYYLKEKQGKQKPADKVEPKFNIGDTIAKKHNYDIFDFVPFTITDITGGKYWYNDRIT